ncbi:MAG: ATP-binding cassette domain-containing protein [Oceanicoccus sp.]|uniref:thiamine ABC transporter ATP-binding protein n=1 Tax=Oceanicoccus sp. TaxID=2691044 RepID=UPI002608C2B8|nr:ATP-binding cassette domain-containing protein [Oceanicoccus sp.]MCP3907889.1 ATP-binding cassette domain-containing protein [Oceanicoccus sp.]
MLSVNQLTFSYSCDDQQMCFDLQVRRGEILSNIGPSGSGKSTLLNLIAGFNLAQSGEVLLDDQLISQLSPSQRPLSMVFQSHNLFPHLDVFTNIALGIKPSLKLTNDEAGDIDQAINTLGLQGLQKRKPQQLSGGQQQRVTIARALVRKQPLLLLDEPFAALGPALRAELIEVLRELVTRNNMIALMVSHQPVDAMLASKQTAFINNGQVIALSATEQLLKNSHNDDIRNYLGSK